MVRRATGSAFMGDARVFPGGAVEPIDDSDLASAAVRWSGDGSEFPWRAAAVRELVEEVGVTIGTPSGVGISGEGRAVYENAIEAAVMLDADELGYVSNWVTPRGPSRRFDTRFYVVGVAAGTEAASDDTEVFDAEWVTPARALERGAAGEWQVSIPTRVHLEQLRTLGTVEAVITYASEVVPERIAPRVVTEGERRRILLPGHHGYEEAPE